MSRRRLSTGYANDFLHMAVKLCCLLTRTQLSFANSWVQYGVFTNRAILSYNGPYNGLGNNQRWSQDRLDVFLEEGEIRGNQSLQILDKQLSNNDWLVLARPTIADISVFVYVALAPMGDISLQPYSNILAWIERIKGLPGFFPIEGLDQPLLHVGRWKSAGRSEPRNVVK